MNRTGAGTLVPSKAYNGAGVSTPLTSNINGTEVPAPEGYKQTKVGVIPEDWEVVRLGNIASRITEKNKDNSIDKVFSNSAINGIVLQSEYFDREIANKNNLTGYYVVESGDFVYNPRISKSAPAGPINRNLNSVSGIVSPLYTVFRTQKNESINYLEYFFSSTLWFRYMQGIANYGARHDRMNITNSDFMKMPIPYPPLKEQQKIAQILTTWDDAISKQEDLIEAKEQLKKGLMQKLLSGEVRFGAGTLVPSKNKGAGVSTPSTGVETSVSSDNDNGTSVPTPEWKEVRLGDIATFFSGGTPTSTNKNYYNGHIPFIGSGDIKKSFVNQFITEEALNNSSAKLVNSGDLLYALYGATSGEVAISQINGAINQAVLCIRTKNNLYYLFQYLLLEKNNIVSTFLQGGQGNLSAKIIKNLKIKLPPKQEQQKIAQVFTTADKEIELLKEEIETLKEQKRGLMQRLLSGVVRTNKIKGKQ